MRLKKKKKSLESKNALFFPRILNEWFRKHWNCKSLLCKANTLISIFFNPGNIIVEVSDECLGDGLLKINCKTSERLAFESSSSSRFLVVDQGSQSLSCCHWPHQTQCYPKWGESAAGLAPALVLFPVGCKCTKGDFFLIIFWNSSVSKEICKMNS